MKNVLRSLVMALGLAAIGAACSQSGYAVTSTQGQAYILRAGMFGSNLYLCKANNGQAVCQQVQD